MSRKRETDRQPSGHISGDQGAKPIGPKDRIWWDVAEQDRQRAAAAGQLAEVALVGAAETEPDDDWLAPDQWGPLDYRTESQQLTEAGQAIL